jgi:maltose O-acetyltransferase
VSAPRPGPVPARGPRPWAPLTLLAAALRRRLRDRLWEIVRGYPPVSVLKRRGLEIGQRVTLTRNVVLDPAHCHLISLGDDVVLGPEVLVLAHDASTKPHLGYTRIDRVRIGDRVFVGAKSVILPGVTIGDDAIIGAGSIVTRDVPAGMVAIGNPAKPIMTTTEYIDRHRSQLGRLPTFSRAWTRRHGLTRERAGQMAEELEQTAGYVQ